MEKSILQQVDSVLSQGYTVKCVKNFEGRGGTSCAQGKLMFGKKLVAFCSTSSTGGAMEFHSEDRQLFAEFKRQIEAITMEDEGFDGKPMTIDFEQADYVICAMFDKVTDDREIKRLKRKNVVFLKAGDPQKRLWTVPCTDMNRAAFTLKIQATYPGCEVM